MTEPWRIAGELILNCNCAVFCPCVVSLGKHPPTEGYCQAWAGVRIDRGDAGGTDLSGLNVALLLDIPGWICLLYTSPSPRDQRGSRMPSSA